MLHPTAIIHPDAQLGEGVTVGPYGVIEGAARIGENSVIHAHAIIGAQVVMGRDNVVGPGSVVGGDPQDLAFRPTVQSQVRIGDRNIIREHCTIHRGTAEGSATVLGDDCFLMAGAHIGHNAQVGSGVILANNVLLGGYAVIADRVFIGGGSVFHQFTRVGRLVICQGLSGFSKFIPPFSVGAQINGVAGLNVIGMRRAGFSAEQRREVKTAFDLLYRAGLNVSQALAAAGERTWGEEGREFWEFVASAKKKGICDFIPARFGQPAPDDE